MWTESQYKFSICGCICEQLALQGRFKCSKAASTAANVPPVPLLAWLFLWPDNLLNADSLVEYIERKAGLRRVHGRFKGGTLFGITPPITRIGFLFGLPWLQCETKLLCHNNSVNELLSSKNGRDSGCKRKLSGAVSAYFAYEIKIFCRELYEQPRQCTELNGTVSAWLFQHVTFVVDTIQSILILVKTKNYCH